MGVIVVDHGSREEEANRWFEGMVERFKREAGFEIVEPAHMQGVEPSIATALRRCVERGAKEIVILPYFLGPGKHWKQDLPWLVEEAARGYPEVRYRITRPVGMQEMMLEVMRGEIRRYLDKAEEGKGDEEGAGV